MEFLRAQGYKLSYKDGLQLDGAFSAAHINYGKSPEFNMEEIPDFCEKYCQMIEGENVEYFRYPEYGKNTYFAGNQLDIEWLSYNFALIILKLLHLVKL